MTAAAFCPLGLDIFQGDVMIHHRHQIFHNWIEWKNNDGMAEKIESVSTASRADVSS